MQTIEREFTVKKLNEGIENKTIVFDHPMKRKPGQWDSEQQTSADAPQESMSGTMGSAFSSKGTQAWSMMCPITLPFRGYGLPPWTYFAPERSLTAYLLGPSLPLSSTMVLTGLLTALISAGTAIKSLLYIVQLYQSGLYSQDFFTVFYKNQILFQRIKRVKNAKIHSFLPASRHYHGVFSDTCRIISNFLQSEKLGNFYLNGKSTAATQK